LATYNSSSITRLGYARGPGVYPQKDSGVISIGNVTLTANDLLPICYIPFGCYISKFLVNFPILNPSGTTLAMSLLDTLASPTTYISASTAGTNFSALTTLSEANFISATWGTTYGATARSIGATGLAVVVWATGVQLQFKVTATASAATGTTVNIPYQVEFSPAYDMGV
jgi:hypothetical protein